MSNIVINGLNIAYKVTGPGSEALIEAGVVSAAAEKSNKPGKAKAADSAVTADAKSDVKTAVVLQGWGTTLDMYDSVAAAINDVYRVVQLDLPGFGDSDEPPEAWNVDAYADFFCRFMEKLGIRKSVLIGHSYGGRVIIKLAARDAGSGDALPFEIDKIMLIDSAGIVPERSWQQKLKVKRFRALRKFLTSPPIHAMFPEVIDFWISNQGSADYRNASPIMKKCLVMAVNEDLRHLFPSVKQETLLVWGDADLDTPISDAHIMEEMMPDAGLAIFEGAGHYSYLEQPVLFRTVIRTYLDADEVKGGAEA